MNFLITQNKTRDTVQRDMKRGESRRRRWRRKKREDCKVDFALHCTSNWKVDDTPFALVSFMCNLHGELTRQVASEVNQKQLMMSWRRVKWEIRAIEKWVTFTTLLSRLPLCMRCTQVMQGEAWSVKSAPKRVNRLKCLRVYVYIRRKGGMGRCYASHGTVVSCCSRLLLQSPSSPPPFAHTQLASPTCLCKLQELPLHLSCSKWLLHRKVAWVMLYKGQEAIEMTKERQKCHTVYVQCPFVRVAVVNRHTVSRQTHVSYWVQEENV